MSGGSRQSSTLPTSARETRVLASKRSAQIVRQKASAGSVSRVLYPRGEDGARSRLPRPRPPLSQGHQPPASERRALVPKLSIAAATTDAQRTQRSLKRKVDQVPDRRPRDGTKTFLESNVPRTSTRARYAHVLVQLATFVALFNIDLKLVVPPQGLGDSLDEAMVEWADYQYFEGHPASVGDTAWAALTDWWPQVSAKGPIFLPRFARARKAWRRLSPGQSRVGLPWSHLCLVLQRLLVCGKFRYAVCFLLMWVCYLRPSELLSIQVEDFIRPTRLSPWFSLRLHPSERQAPSKVGAFDDGIPLENGWAPWIGSAVQRLVKGKARGSKLVDVTYLELRKEFMTAMGHVGLRDPSLYRLRHGGASSDVASKKRTLEQVKKRGRWQADESVRRYTQVVRLQAEDAQLSGELAAKAAAVAVILEKLFGA